MAYFNHAFRQTHVGTGGFTKLDGGKLGTSGNVLAAGEFTLVDPKTWNVLEEAPENCCPLMLVSGSLMRNDKIGPFHGGYQASNKSKTINPKYVSRFWTSPAHLAQNHVLHIGRTPFTNPEEGDPVEGCCPKFVCGETYSLRIDIKGSPVLRFLNRNTYLTVDAYTGCCPDDAIEPTPVDSTLVFIEWANNLINSPLISPFVSPVVVDQEGNIYYAPGTEGVDTWDTYVSPGYIEDECAGMILYGAYVDTKFGDCSFQVTDFYEKEPVTLYASAVDQNGDPCAFEGLCVVTECAPRQANGFGETVLRDVILDQSYRQNFFHSDIRIREITQGDSFLNVINRNAFYDRMYIQHNVPRFNNPTSTFDNDQYLLEIVVPAGTVPNSNIAPDPAIPVEVIDSITSFIELVGKWLSECGVCEIEDLTSAEACEPLIANPPARKGGGVGDGIALPRI
jgi:hypothetical protein